MNKKEYAEMRTALIAEADFLLADSKIEDANAKMTEVEDLDNKFNEDAKAFANMEALKDKTELFDVTKDTLEIKGDVKNMEMINNTAEMVAVVDRPEYKNAFLRKLQGKDLTVQENALVTASGAIPTQTMNKIVEMMEEIAPILTKVDLSYIPSNLSIPVEGTVNEAAWVAMGTAATDSADSITTVSLAAYKLIKTVEIGADTSVMAVDAFEAYLVNRLSHKIAKALENAVFNGTGASQPTGLLKAGEITNVGTWTKAAMTYADVLKIIAALPDHGYRAGASFAMPSAVFYGSVLPSLTNAGAGLNVQAAESFKILGYDVIVCDRIAADTIVFGNFKNYAMNIADGVKIEADKSVGFRSGSTVYRAMALVDGKTVNKAAFCVFTKALA